MAVTQQPVPIRVTHAGVAVPQLIYGTAWKKDRTAALVTQALVAGFTGVDTACQPKHYSESGVGEALAAATLQGVDREHLYVQTKFTSLSGQNPQRVPYDPQAPLSQQVAQSFETSLANLGAGRIDSLILHSPLATRAQTMTVWRAMTALQRQGQVGQLGISNCYDFEHFCWLFHTAEVKPAVLQNRFYRDSGYDKRLRAFCRDQGVVYQSFWTLTANPKLLQSDPVVHAARRHGRTAAQVLFRWLTQQGACPLTGTTSARHMAQDLAIFTFELEPRELDAIDALL